MAAGETSPPLIRTGEEWALSISRDRTDYVLSHNTSSTKAALEQAEAERARLLAAPPPHTKSLDKLTAFLPNATARYRTLVDSLAALPLRHVEQAREQIKALAGEITLWPTPAGYLEAEVTGSYAGFLKLAVGQYGHPYGENNGLYPPQ
jgi:hypothetical protein